MSTVEDNTCTKIEFCLSASGLLDKDVLSKSDPFVIAYMALPDKNTTTLHYSILGYTEVKQNNLNPVFTKRIPMDFHFEVKQCLKFELYDCDDEKHLTQLDKHNKLGYVETDMAYIMGQRGNATLNLKDGRGTITIKVVELGNGDMNEMVSFQIVGSKMKKMDLFEKSDPYLKIFRLLPSGICTLLRTTEIVKNTLEPTWKGFELPVGQLCGGMKESPCIRIECWDWDRMTDHDSMGEAIVSVQMLLTGKPIELRKPQKPEKLYGILHFKGTRIHRTPSFLDYIKGGVSLSLTVCIDFTASNRDPHLPDSLHFMNPQAPNHYTHAIMAVGDVLQGYVTDQACAVFGFGAILPHEHGPNHMFPLTFDDANPYVRSIQEILGAYTHVLTQVRLSGPTNFAPSVRAATAASLQRPRSYSIMLIITDGEITDMKETIDALVAASRAPLSIVIIGVGTECDFQQMIELDGDTEALVSTTGVRSERDLVQFVPMKSFCTAPPHVLAGEVLREIPVQFLKWAKLTNFVCPM